MRLKYFTFGYEVSMSELLKRLALLSQDVLIQSIQIGLTDVTIGIVPKQYNETAFNEKRCVLGIRSVKHQLAPTDHIISEPDLDTLLKEIPQDYDARVCRHTYHDIGLEHDCIWSEGRIITGDK